MLLSGKLIVSHVFVVSTFFPPHRYCGPMTLLGYLYIRTSRELRPPDGPLSIMMFEARAEARSKQL